jgi:hypothetical protein
LELAGRVGKKQQAGAESFAILAFLLGPACSRWQNAAILSEFEGSGDSGQPRGVIEPKQTQVKEFHPCKRKSSLWQLLA